MNRRIEKIINNIYQEVFKQVFTRERLDRAERGDKSVISKALTNFKTSEKYKEFCKKFAQTLAKRGLAHEKGLWRKYYEAAKTKHMYGLPSTYSDFEKKMYEKIVKKNFTMIKSIPDSIMKVWKQKDVITLLRQTLEGKVGRGTFEKQLRLHGAKNAKMIARTETAKLQTAVNEVRSKQLGSTAYIWRSSSDPRTRPSHRKMNGVLVFWRPDAEKPLLDKMRGNSGEFPNCRCHALPVFDETDIPTSSVKVYNYKTDKIIKMSKKDVKNALKVGHL